MPPASPQGPRLSRFALYPQHAIAQAPPARVSHSQELTTVSNSESYSLEIRQQPEAGKAIGGKPQDRKPVDPPPIIRLQIWDPKDPTQNYLQSPYYLCVCTLWHPVEDRAATNEDNNSPPLAGTLVSSLHKLKDVDNHDKGFFVFGDVSVRNEGEYRLRFVLFEMLAGQAISLKHIVSDRFTVYPAKSFPGLKESSFLSRSFGDQGVRLRIRKDGRSASKRNAKSQNVGDENTYEAKSQPNTTPNSQQSIYADTSTYSRSFSGHEQNIVKRQRTSGELGGNPYDRDPWMSAAPQSAGIYPTSTGSMSAYPHDGVSASQFYRGNDYSVNQTPSLYSRSSMNDYGQGQQQLSYGSRNYSQSDPSASMDGYSDSTYASLHDTNAAISPTSHSQSLRSDTSALADPTLKSNYRVGMPNTISSANVLPLPINTPSSSMSSAGLVQPAYGYSYPDTTRTYPQTGGQPGMRTGYSGFQGQYSMQTPYQST